MPERRFDNGSIITFDEEIAWSDDIVVGPDVQIECEQLSVGSGVRIGSADDREAFRYPGGVRIRARALRLSGDVRVGRHTSIEGGDIVFGRGVAIGNAVSIRVLETLTVGAGGSVQDRGEIGGVDISIGRRLWMLPDAKVGGGAAFEVHSKLRVGHWAHLGVRTLLNTARALTLGDEVGLGTGTSLYTHGAYPSAIEGKPVSFAPVSIGDRTWLPGAVVNPGVTIGADVVVAVGSVVTKDLPDGCLAAGVPAKVVREGAFPKPMDADALASFIAEFLQVFAEICSDRDPIKIEAPGRVQVGDTPVVYDRERAAAHGIVLVEDASDLRAPDDVTVIGLRDRTIAGPSSPLSERLLNQLRRYGIRFWYDAREGRYVPWSSLPDELA